MHEIDKQSILDLATSIDNLTSAITCLEKDSRPQNTNQRRVASLQRQSDAVAYIDETVSRTGENDPITWALNKVREILLS